MSFGLPTRNSVGLGLGGVAPLSSGVADAVRAIFSLGDYKTAVPEVAGDATVTFSRADGTNITGRKYVPDFEGRLVYCLAGEVPFSGGRRVYNRIGAAYDYTAWTNETMLVVGGVTDPSGGTNAYTFTAQASPSRRYALAAATLASDVEITSYWVKRSVGHEADTGTVSILNPGSNNLDITANVTSSWKRFCTTPVSTGGGQHYIGIRLGTSGDAVDVAFVQPEVVTGQTNQNPGEYVSVGVLSSPYHGAMVDGVQWYDTLNGNTVSSNVVSENTGALISSSTAKFGAIAGTVAQLDYFSTPNQNKGGSFTLTSDIYLSTYRPTVYYLWDSVAGTGGFRVTIDSSGRILVLLRDGSGTTTYTSTATISNTTNPRKVIQVVYDEAAHTLQSFIDGVELEAAVSTAGQTVAANSVVWGFGYCTVVDSRQYSTTLIIGNSSPVSLNFNPNLSTTAQTFTAATGEVWTSNGNARIFGNTSTTYGIPAPWDSTGPAGYLPEVAATCRALQSNSFRIDNQLTVSGSTGTFTQGEQVTDGTLTGYYDGANSTATLFALYGSTGTTWAGTLTDVATGAKTRTIASTVTVWQSGGGGVVVVADSIAAPDGTTTADTLTGGANGTLLQTLVAGSAAKTGSIWIKRKTGTGNIDLTMDGGTGWTTVSVDGNWTEFSKTQTLANESFGIRIVTATDAVYVWQGNVVTAATKTSPITTVTAAVTRARDAESYAAAGNINRLAGSIALTVQGINAADTHQPVLFTAYSGGNDEINVQLTAAGLPKLIIYSGGALQCNITGTTDIRGARHRVGFTWTTNEAKLYIDGVQEGSTDPLVTPPAVLATIVVGGYSAATQELNGSVKDIVIYDRVLSAARMATL